MNAPARSPDQVPDRKVTDHLHPLVHLAAGALLIWFVVAAWLLFDDAGYLKLALAMISVLVFMVLAIPAALARTAGTAQRLNPSPEVTREADAGERASESLDTWLQGRFTTWTDQEESSTAAVEILLPLAAVAFALTALGIVLELTRAGVV